MNTRYFLITTALAGALTALLSAVPFINLVNCLLCGWLWIGGIFAVWLYRYFSDASVERGQGAMLGAVMGLFAAVIATLLGLIAGTSASSVTPDQMAQLEEMMGESAQILTSPTTLVTISLVANLIFDPLFGALGGLIGASIFKSKPAAI